MEMKDVWEIEDELTRTKELYKIFNEDGRLNSKANNIEFITTTKYIEEYLKPGNRILDLGAGTGVYSVYFSQKGYDVVAVELLELHTAQIREKDPSIEIHTANAIDYIKTQKDNSFDQIFVFGPIYHMEEYVERIELLRECRRVVKPDGKVFISIINHDSVIFTETFLYTDGNILMDRINLSEDFTLRNRPFIFHKLEDFREMLESAELKLIRTVAQEGIAEMMAEKIDAFDDETYSRWVDFHFYICEKPEFIGLSNHNLFICEK